MAKYSIQIFINGLKTQSRGFASQCVAQNGIFRMIRTHWIKPWFWKTLKKYTVVNIRTEFSSELIKVRGTNWGEVRGINWGGEVRSIYRGEVFGHSEISSL